MSPGKKSADSVTGTLGVLATWKGIAAYFGCNVRTVRRYEIERGLPVHRAPGTKGCTVFAYASELDAWLGSKDNNEQKHGPAVCPDRTALYCGDAEQNHSLEPAVSQLSAKTVAEHSAIEGLLRRKQPWIFAASALLIASLGLFWIVEDRQAASADTTAKLNKLESKPNFAAPATEDLILRGRYFWSLRTADGLAKAIDAYTQAIVKDPSDAEAYAGLAEAYDLLPQFGHADLGDSLIKAENAADRAIELDPNFAAAHTAKAFALFYWDWDIAGSEAEFRKALALDPKSAQTHQWYAGTLEWRSEGAEAIRQIDEAVLLDPTSPAIAADAALLHIQFGDFRSGVKALREIEQTQPTLASPAEFLSVFDFNAGNLPTYVEDVRRIASITHAPDDVRMANAVAQGWARAGRAGLLEARVEALKAAFDHGSGSGFELGETLLLLGRREEALFYFKASLDRHAVQLLAVQDFPWARRLSSDPGYAALFAHVRSRIREETAKRTELARFATAIPQ